MLDSIYIGMSGLTAHSKGLQTISNNVANLNTPGFKSTTPRFSDLYYGQRFFGEGPDSARITSSGSGVQYSYSSLNFKQGEIRASDGQLDLGIEGSGFLALLDDEGKARYARTGQFTVDDDGSLREKNNDLRLTTVAADGTLAPVSVDKKRTNPSKATRTITFKDNVHVNQVDPITISNVEVYDSSGGKQTLAIKLTRDTTTPVPSGTKAWDVRIETKDGRFVGEGDIRFMLQMIDPGYDRFDFTFSAEGIAPSTITLDFSDVTYQSGPGQGSNMSSLAVNKIDGYGLGTMSSLKVDDKGVLVVNYSNGQTTELGQVAMANFADPQRLVQLGDGLFDASQLPPPAYVASKQGAGELASGVIEASNVDLSTEFGRLILIQRGFQASSQVISTANEMIMQLFQMKSGQG